MLRFTSEIFFLFLVLATCSVIAGLWVLATCGGEMKQAFSLPQDPCSVSVGPFDSTGTVAHGHPPQSVPQAPESVKSPQIYLVIYTFNEKPKT